MRHVLLACCLGLLLSPTAGHAKRKRQRPQQKQTAPSKDAAARAALQRAKDAYAKLEMVTAAEELQAVVVDAHAPKEVLIEAHLLGGVVQRIMENDVAARLHFHNALDLDDSVELTGNHAPKVVAFFQLVKNEHQKLKDKPAATTTVVTTPGVDEKDIDAKVEAKVDAKVAEAMKKAQAEEDARRAQERRAEQARLAEEKAAQQNASTSSTTDAGALPPADKSGGVDMGQMIIGSSITAVGAAVYPAAASCGMVPGLTMPLMLVGVCPAAACGGLGTAIALVVADAPFTDVLVGGGLASAASLLVAGSVGAGLFAVENGLPHNEQLDAVLFYSGAGVVTASVFAISLGTTLFMLSRVGSDADEVDNATHLEVRSTKMPTPATRAARHPPLSMSMAF